MEFQYRSRYIALSYTQAIIFIKRQKDDLYHFRRGTKGLSSSSSPSLGLVGRLGRYEDDAPPTGRAESSSSSYSSSLSCISTSSSCSSGGVFMSALLGGASSSPPGSESPFFLRRRLGAFGSAGARRPLPRFFLVSAFSVSKSIVPPADGSGMSCTSSLRKSRVSVVSTACFLMTIYDNNVRFSGTNRESGGTHK